MFFTFSLPTKAISPLNYISRKKHGYKEVSAALVRLCALLNPGSEIVLYTSEPEEPNLGPFYN